MHSALAQELVDLRGRDTEVSVPVFRRHRIRAVPAPIEAQTAESTETNETNEIRGPWIDPGDTMSRSTAVQVLLREAIVRKNHRTQRAPVTGCIEIDWVRSRDLSVKRIGRGVIRIAGPISKLARVSIGIDGLAFTVAIQPNQRPADAIAERLSLHYQVEILEETGGDALVVLTGFAPILR